MADRDIETVVDGMQTPSLPCPYCSVQVPPATLHVCGPVVTYEAGTAGVTFWPLACGCDPETDYKCPEHRTEPA